MPKPRMNHLSLYVEKWIDDLITLKAKKNGVSKSELIRTLVKNSLVRTPEKRFEKTGYINDEKGILRSVNKH